ncbi:MAG: cytochrome c3 family protein [Myxococcales bacterium]|nr:cytochrome c3 family protein [Myxococcales bacterium]
MAALFPPWTNAAMPLGVVMVAAAGAAAIVGPMVYVRMPYSTEQLTPVEQPVEFDHRHHVGDAQIDCVYCHSGAEKAASAGVPDTETCMGCHSQVWSESVLLEPVASRKFEP